MLAAVAVVTLAVAVGPGRAAAAPTDADPATVEVQSDLTYATPDGTAVQLDAYLPPPGTGTSTDRPAVVLIHGGGWKAGDKSGVAALGRAIAAHGWPAFAIDYRMTTDHPWPDELNDVRAAVRWVQDNADRFGVDPSRVAAFGGSAGGHLAMMAGTTGVGDGHAPLKAVVSWSGPTDLRTITSPDVPPSASPTVPGTRALIDPVGCGTDTLCVGYLDPSLVPDFIGCAIDVCPDAYASASPVVQVTKAAPPMFLANSETELVPVSQLYEMANALNAAGRSSTLLVVPGDRHADAYADVALAPSIAFLDTFLADSAPAGITPKSPPTTASGSAALPELTDGWQLPNAAAELPRDLRGTDPWWQRALPYALVFVAAAILVGAIVTRVRSRRSTPAP